MTAPEPDRFEALANKLVGTMTTELREDMRALGSRIDRLAVSIETLATRPPVPWPMWLALAVLVAAVVALAGVQVTGRGAGGELRMGPRVEVEQVEAVPVDLNG